jgi:hypothetical protein
VAPSLFHRDPQPVLSELYGLNGVSRFSLVDGDDQFLWEARFAPPEPDYYRARLAMMSRGNAEVARAELKVPPETILDRLRMEFAAAPPLRGTGPPRLALERWEAEGGTQAFQDPRRMAEMAQTLVKIWSAFIPMERPPGEEAREWYTAESP